MAGFLGWGPTAGELKRRLADDCERVVEVILPDCRRKGSELRGHGQDGSLWVVETRGRKRGVALCVADPDRSGDLLDLATHALCGGDRSTAYHWARQYLGGTVDRPPPAPRPDPKRANETEAERRKRFWGWYEGAAQGAGSPVEGYLGGRGLGRDIIALPPCLRFAPNCLYGKDQQSNRWLRYPAMLAPITDPLSGAFLSLHCTYLEPVNGVWRKISSHSPRRCWGSPAGGVIELSNGASEKALRDAPEGAGCLIGEGIENVMSASFLRPELHALAGYSIGNLSKIALPPQIELVVLVVDDDGEKTKLNEDRDRAIERWHREGRRTGRMVPTRGYKDLNEQLISELSV